MLFFHSLQRQRAKLSKLNYIPVHELYLDKVHVCHHYLYKFNVKCELLLLHGTSQLDISLSIIEDVTVTMIDY